MSGDLTCFLLPSSRLTTDVIFIVGEERIPAHKVTLSVKIFGSEILLFQIFVENALTKS